MGLQEHKNQFAVKATSSEGFSARLLGTFYDELGDLAPTYLNTSGDTISFVGGVFRLVRNTNLLVAISRGTVSAKPTDNGAIIRYIISFRQIIVVGTAMILIASIWILSEGAPDNLPFLITGLAIGWLWLVGMNIFISILRFDRFIKKCAKRAGATDIKRIKTITLSK